MPTCPQCRLSNHDECLKHQARKCECIYCEAKVEKPTEHYIYGLDPASKLDFFGIIVHNLSYYEDKDDSPMPRIQTLRKLGNMSYDEILDLLTNDLFSRYPPYYIVVDYTNEKILSDLLAKSYGEEKRWTNIGISTVTNKLKGKHELEIEGFQNSIKEFTKRLENQSNLINDQSKKIEYQSKLIKDLSHEKTETKWIKNYFIKLIISIGIAIFIPVILFLTDSITETGNIIAIIGIESVGIIGIFIPWIFHHKSKTK